MGEGTRDLRGSVTGGRGAPVEAWVERRRPYLDNLELLLVAAIGSVAGSFALAWLLITRVPGAGRVL